MPKWGRSQRGVQCIYQTVTGSPESMMGTAVISNLYMGKYTVKQVLNGPFKKTKNGFQD